MKNIKFWYGIAGLLFIIGIAVSVWMLQKPDSSTVVILQDGKVLYQLCPEDYKEPETIEIGYGSGKNTILIEEGKICISHADCPDQTCVKMGYLQSPSLPIVCLPHHLVIQYGSSHAETLDGTAG